MYNNHDFLHQNSKLVPSAYQILRHLPKRSFCHRIDKRISNENKSLFVTLITCEEDNGCVGEAKGDKGFLDRHSNHYALFIGL